MFTRFVPAFLTVLFVLARGEDDDIKYEEDVMVLTDANFDGAVAANKYLLVEFYAPWCGHCKSLAPEYAKAAGKLKETGAEPKLAKVDATAQTKVAEQFKVQGYPTLKFFKNGTPVEFGGGRTADEIVSWLLKKTGPSSATLASKEEADKFIEGSDVVVVGFFPDAESDEAKTYISAADTIDDVLFGHISDAAVAEALKIKENGIVVFKKTSVPAQTYPGKISHRSQFKAWIFDHTWIPIRELNEKFDDERVDYEGQSDVGDITTFVKGNQLPLVSEFTQESAPKIFGGSITTHNLLFIKKSSGDYQTIYDAFKTAAAEFKGQVLFIYIDADVEDNARVMEFFGLEAKDCPDYRIVKMDEDMAKYKPPTKDLDVESVITFTKKVASGEVSRHLNSQEVPEDWNKNAVAVLVGKNFREVAFDPNKKVFVEFYAPWCGHCKQLAPIWDKLGEKYADNENIVIAKMDSTANEVEEIKVTGFPTLKYFPDDKEESVIDYNGERTFDALVKFIDSDGKEVSGEMEEEDMDEIVPRKEGDLDMPDMEGIMEKDRIDESAEVYEAGDDIKKQTTSAEEAKESLKNVTVENAKAQTTTNKEEAVANRTKPEDYSTHAMPDVPEMELKPGQKPTPEELEAANNDPNNPFRNMTPEQRQQKMAEMDVEFKKMHEELNAAMKKLSDPEDIDEDEEDQEQEEVEAATDQKDEL